MFLNKFTVGKRIWKFNNSLLKSQDYLNLINNAIDDEILKYALPIYSLQFLKQIPPNITFTIDDDLFLEMLFLRIRGDTIKYASSLKKHNKTKEDQLLKDIAYLESQLDNNSHNYQLLIDKQLELENLRKIKVDGEQIRSRHQWLKEGEKPSKFFCNLENKNLIEKTIKSVQLQDGSFVTKQNQILSHIRNFYVHLFTNKDDTLDID